MRLPNINIPCYITDFQSSMLTMLLYSPHEKFEQETKVLLEKFQIDKEKYERLQI